MRKLIGIIFLLFQVYMIIYARFSEARYFCWAPFDAQNEFVLKITTDDRILSRQEIFQRYRMPPSGLDSRSIQHIKDYITQYEETYGRNDQAKVELHHKVNGVPQEVWLWPPN